MTSVRALMHTIVAIARKGTGLQLAIQPTIMSLTRYSLEWWVVTAAFSYTIDSMASCSSNTQQYSHFTISSPDCTLHTANTHVITVLERWSLTHDYAIGIHVRLHHSNTLIM